ncbi:hypothetical protein EV198_0908 [Roseivirga ehrenbergii]|uniref:Uncharacterized protein n=1 Tax=Roseivirga ehrenbergii (strain DSM 102268 / JCM 13514 / KCTC 12282 / NCIMB 14502 / KMM 6017) TaxID=279360 RepID=A0A150X7E1_ROSEK|nr:hypothetical protein [Roseivirga ehrenbergii]KYG74610.1 hypothetical protein MB14_05220 [Roseivirga ehrenbergii]TCL14072.1 hypothetical protein EV198_0908 [Roseivirga ehrenbergii]
MGIARENQSIQDWITQQWVILFGQRINNKKHQWLLGPFGGTKEIGIKFVEQLAKNESLVIDTQRKNKGLLDSILNLGLPENELKRLSPNVINFYESTSNYDLLLKAKWNPFFKVFGIVVKSVFSKRIEQLNVPIENLKDASGLTNEIIKLVDTKTNEVKRTIWLRTLKSTGQVVYSGVYETCSLPNKQICIKAIFPLPNGNATVILTPSVGRNGELILDSSGQRIGNSGFYFLLRDSKGQLWSKFIKSFKDKLVVKSINDKISATQTLTLWNLKVLEFEYEIKKNYTQQNL